MTRPSCCSRRNASRTGVMLTSNCLASLSMTSFWPGTSWPEEISSPSRSYTASVNVPRPNGWIVLMAWIMHDPRASSQGVALPRPESEDQSEDETGGGRTDRRRR
ncbi:hypothetical protein GCM10023317_62280 [Actinopolymorpha pittospori]